MVVTLGVEPSWAVYETAASTASAWSQQWLQRWESHPRGRAYEARLNLILPAIKWHVVKESNPLCKVLEARVRPVH